VIPAFDEPLHDGLNGVVQPASACAALGLGQRLAEAPLNASQRTWPGVTTQTDVDLSHVIWMPELPQAKVPWHGPAVSLLSHAPLVEELHAATTKTKARTAGSTLNIKRLRVEGGGDAGYTVVSMRGARVKARQTSS
jgi:hypothetical protein